MKKRVIQIVVTLVFSAAALYLAFRKIEFEAVGQAFRQVAWGWLIPTQALIFGTLVLRAERWRVLLDQKVTLRDSFGLINIGYLVSAVLPARAGDPARAIAATLRGPVTVLAALSTVVVERVLDLFLVILILLGTLPFVPGIQDYVSTGQVNERLSLQLVLALSGALAVGLLAGFVLVALLPRQTMALGERVLSLLRIREMKRWLKPLSNIVEGLAVLRSPRKGLAIIGWSLALWALTVSYFLTAMQACRAFLPNPSLLKSSVATWSSAFGMIFPAQGGVGSFHFAVRESLYLGFAIPREIGFTYAVLVHALPYLTGIVLGVLTLLTWGLSFRSLVGRATRPLEAAEAESPIPPAELPGD